MSSALLPTALLLAGLVVSGPHAALAQTATVTATQGAACAGTRFGRDLNCTSNDFTANLSFTQPAGSAISSCVAGQFVTIDVVADVSSNSPVRYDVGFFLGEQANNPQLNNAANTCSHALFPTTPAPFNNLDADTCGDFNSTSSATLLIRGVRLRCEPATGTNRLRVPYVLAFDNQTGGATCNAANQTAGTTAKCVSDGSGTGLEATVTGVSVQGYLRIVKAVAPAGQTQSFAFTASGTGTTPSVTSFSLTGGGSQQITAPLSDTGSAVTLTVSEAATAGWDPTAAIRCVGPDGVTTASFVTINAATRTVTASLDKANYGATCTVTNTKLATLTLTKSINGGTATTADFTLAYAGPDSGSGTAGSPAVTARQVRAGTYALSETTAQTGYSLTGLTCSGGAYTTTSPTNRQVVLGAGETVSCAYNNFKPTPVVVFGKTASLASVSARGITITYTVSARNTGNVPLTGVSLSDTLTLGATTLTLSSGPTLSSGDANGNGQIDIGETFVWTATYVTSQAAIDAGGSLLNSASLRTTELNAGPATATTTIGGAPVMTVAKTAVLIKRPGNTRTGFAETGDTVRYDYVASNTGAVTITNVEITDVHNGNGTLPDPAHLTLTDNAPAGDSTDTNADATVWGRLAPGDSITFRTSYTVTQADQDRLW